MKRANLLIVGVIMLIVAAVISIARHGRREAAVARATLASVDLASCRSAISLGETCGRCVAAYCCNEMTTCYGASDCIDLNDCTVNCGEEEMEPEKVDKAECRRACAKKHPSSRATFGAWEDCSLAHCASVCPRPPKE